MSYLTHCMLIFTWLYISAFRNVSFLPLCHWIIRTLPLRTFICTLKCFHAPLLVSFQQSHGVEVTTEEIVHFSNFLDFALHLCFRDLAKKIRATDRGHLVSLDKDIGRKQKKHKNKFDIHKSLICRRVRGGHAAGSCSHCIRLRNPLGQRMWSQNLCQAATHMRLWIHKQHCWWAIGTLLCFLGPGKCFPRLVPRKKVLNYFSTAKAWLFKIYIYLFDLAKPGLTCGTWDLGSPLQHENS